MNLRARDLAKIALSRQEPVLEEARAAGLLGVARDARISGRVPARLIDVAKKRAGVTSETELLGVARDARISGRVLASLINAAKKRAQATSDTELLELLDMALSLSLLTLEDDFGEKLLRRKGTIPADVDLEF